MRRVKKTGRLFVISGPSGCGKTTLCRELLKRKTGLVDSVSTTTRPCRKGEKEGTDYFFTTKAIFENDIRKNRFLEYATVFGNYYGTPKKFVLDNLKNGKDVLLSIDVQGAAQIKKVFKRAVLIFIKPPAFNELKNRLLKRSSDSREQIEKRLRIARREMKAMSIYDHVVVNDSLKQAVGELLDIIG